MLGIDSEPAAIARLSAARTCRRGHRLETQVATFEDAHGRRPIWSMRSFALFFCEPGAFAPLWRKIVASLKPGGRFAGQLLGERDSWASRPRVVVHDDAAVAGLLAGLDVEMHEIEETDGVTPRGEAKHWHIHHLVFRLP